MKLRQTAAFTLIELLIAALVGSILGGIIYLVASEGLTSFARNTSLNRGYTEARSAIDQINGNLLTAGHSPTFLDASGSVSTASQAEGVRFYRSSSLPTYEVASGSSTDGFLLLNYNFAQAANGGSCPIEVGDLVAVPLLGFQGIVASTTVTTTSTGGQVKVVFASPITTVASGCVPTLTGTLNLGYQTTTPPTYYTAVVYRQVAYIAVPNTVLGGGQLRYYPRAMSTGSGKASGNLAAFNSTTAFNDPKNYSVLANIATSVSDATLTPLKPFVNPDASNVLQVVLCAQGPDYNNRTSLGASNTYSLMQSSMGSRCPILLRSMSVPF